MDRRIVSTWIPAVALAALVAGCGSSNPYSTGGGGGGGGGINGCTTFMDESATGASRTVTFTYPSYSPPCMQVAVGQSVMFSGDFAVHPLVPGVAPGASGTASAGNPIPSTSSGSSLTVAFPAAGTYPYYCAVHYGSGMYGAIEVK